MRLLFTLLRSRFEASCNSRKIQSCHLGSLNSRWISAYLLTVQAENIQNDNKGVMFDAGGALTEQVKTDGTTDSLTRSKALNTLRVQPRRDKGMERMESNVTT